MDLLIMVIFLKGRPSQQAAIASTTKLGFQHLPVSNSLIVDT